MEFSRPEYWSGYSFPSPGHIPNPGIEPRSPSLHVDSLPAEPQGKPKNTGVVSLSLLSGSSQPRSSKPRSSWLRNWNRVSYIAGGFFTNWAIRETQITRWIPRNLNTVLVQFKWFKATYIYKFATFSSVQSLSCVWLFVTPWTAAHQASLSITNSQSPPKPMSIELVMPFNHLIFCHLLILLPSIFPSIRVFSNESTFHIRWPKYWSFSFNISPSNEYPGLISFRMDWLDLLAVQGTLKSLLQHHSSKASILRHSTLGSVILTPLSISWRER